MLWAMCCLCFLQSGKVMVPSEAVYNSGTHLNINYVAVDDFTDPIVVNVTIKAVEKGLISV